MRRKPLAAMLTLAVAAAATVAVAGCGGKASSSGTPTTHKPPSHAPGY
jgi:hypothetical protein